MTVHDLNNVMDCLDQTTNEVINRSFVRCFTKLYYKH